VVESTAQPGTTVPDQSADPDDAYLAQRAANQANADAAQLIWIDETTTATRTYVFAQDPKVLGWFLPEAPEEAVEDTGAMDDARDGADVTNDDTTQDTMQDTTSGSFGPRY
jgi:hypothetical protein